MVLNKSSTIHVRIRKLCYQLELLTDMKLVTNLSEEFNEIRLINKLGYIVIDYERNAVYSLGIHLDKIQLDIVQDIILYCSWIETGDRIKRTSCNTNVILNFSKTVDK